MYWFIQNIDMTQIFLYPISTEKDHAILNLPQNTVRTCHQQAKHAFRNVSDSFFTLFIQQFLSFSLLI